MTLSGYLQECASRSAGVLGDDLDASVTLRQHGLTLHAGSSSRAAERCDQAEAMVDEGPCVDAMATGAKVDVASVRAEVRWHAWRAQTLEEGFVRALAVPSEVAPGVSVALNLYSRAGAGGRAGWSAPPRPTPGSSPRRCGCSSSSPTSTTPPGRSCATRRAPRSSTRPSVR